MKWHLHQLGFLPNEAPRTALRDPALQTCDRLGADLPRLVAEKRFREASADYLKLPANWLDPAADPMDIERLFMLFSYFASAYVHSPGLPPVTTIPSPIAAPLVKLSTLVERPPILSYASYCLHNWKRTDPTGPVALGNLELLQNFSQPDEGKKDEDWFILVHVNIEANAGQALQALRSNEGSLETRLATALAGIDAMNRTMLRMPEQCSPEVYFRKVRPYIFGFDHIVYEGCFDEAPQSFRGETGAQSSIVPTFLRAFGIDHQNSLLTKHLEDMRNYMPAPHRSFIETQPSIREQVLADNSPRVKDLYNDCLNNVIAFRSRHFEYAVNYIEKKVDNPLGTGGTPYIPWLKQLIEETRDFLLA